MHMADEGGGSGTVMRVYRKVNWTVSETMVLIEAKQMDEERRMKRSNSSSTTTTTTTTNTTGESSESSRSYKPVELRWRWVEDYCWRKGCLRSQNQCNDKWDNLMRDYKKIRDYERKSSSLDHLSYWKMEKNERKERNLPANMLLQIYEALVEVVDKKGSGQRVIAGAGGGSAGSGSDPNVGFVMERPMICTMVQPVAATAASLPPMALQQQHQHQLSAAISVLPLPQAQPLPPPPLQPLPPHLQAAAPTVDSDTSEYSDDSPAKRRRRQGGGNVGDQQGTSSAIASQELGTAILKSASIIAEALHACEEREERRHRDLVSLHEKILKIEESKSEIKRQGIIGLIDAINKLDNSIFALAFNNNNQQSAPK